VSGLSFTWARNKQPFDFFISLICMVTKITAQITEIWHVSLSLQHMLYSIEWQDNYAWQIGKKMGSYKTVVCTLWPSTLVSVTHGVFLKYSTNTLNILTLSFKNPIWNFTKSHISVWLVVKNCCALLLENTARYFLYIIWDRRKVTSNLHTPDIQSPYWDSKTSWVHSRSSDVVFDTTSFV